MATNPVVVEAWRGGAVESWHRGAFAVVDADGALRGAAGDIDRPVFPRSAVKLLQALPLVASGAADRFGLAEDALALACASHGGEAPHVATAQAALARAGLDAGALECGAHWPYHDASARALAAAGGTPSALHNNCSGKHAGFVCLGCAIAGRDGEAARGWLRGYGRPEHPVMREVGAALQAATGWNLSRSPAGTDGCSIPTHAVPLRHLALAFARVAGSHGLAPAHAAAARRLLAAAAAHPRLVAGSGRFDTRVIERLGPRVYCKVGAEGVYCAAFPALGLGAAIKIDDGATARACEVAMAAVAEALLAPEGDDAAFLSGLSEAPVVNWNGIEVGALKASAHLRAALAG